MQNLQATVITTSNQALNRGRQILHLVLQKKPFSEKIMEELENEISDRMGKFVSRIYKKLEQTKFENPQQSIKVILLKALVQIMRNMVKEYQQSLSPDDLKIIEEIFQKEENDIKIEEQKIKNIKESSIDEDINQTKLDDGKCAIQ
jgi:hypothetical protein